MENLKLHSLGRGHHLKSITKEFKTLINVLKNDPTLSNEERDIEIRRARASFDKQKKQLLDKLF